MTSQDSKAQLNSYQQRLDELMGRAHALASGFQTPAEGRQQVSLADAQATAEAAADYWADLIAGMQAQVMAHEATIDELIGLLELITDRIEGVAKKPKKDDNGSNDHEADEEPQRSAELAQLEERMTALEDKLAAALDYVEWVVAYLGKKEEEWR